MVLSVIESARERLLAEFRLYPDEYLVVGPKQFAEIRAAGGLSAWVTKLMREVEEAESEQNRPTPPNRGSGTGR